MKLLRLLALVIAITWLVPQAAFAGGPDPKTCLPSCYAYNRAPEGGRGTQASPWRLQPSEFLSRVELIADAAFGKTDATFTYVECNNKRPPQCTGRRVDFYKTGSWRIVELGPVPVPHNGASLPFPYIVTATGILGALSVMAGAALRRRALASGQPGITERPCLPPIGLVKE
jgi:hypothetical protein